MNIESKKVNLISWIANTHNKKLIDRIEKLIEEDTWWDDLNESVKKDIIASDKQANKGDLMSHNEVMAKYQKYV